MDRGVGVVVLAAAVLIALIGFVGCLDRALHSAGVTPPPKQENDVEVFVEDIAVDRAGTGGGGGRTDLEEGSSIS